MTNQKFREYLNKADESIKATNGHYFVTILKTRCQHCNKRPGIKTRCGSWFQTFTIRLTEALMKDGIIKD